MEINVNRRRTSVPRGSRVLVSTKIPPEEMSREKPVAIPPLQVREIFTVWRRRSDRR